MKKKYKKVIILILIIFFVVLFAFGWNFYAKKYKGTGFGYYWGTIRGMKTKTGFDYIKINSTESYGSFSGFNKYVFAQGLIEPSSLVYDKANRRLFVTNTGSNQILVLEDEDNDHQADELKEFAQVDNPIGVAYNDGFLYVSTPGHILYFYDGNNDNIGELNGEVADLLPVGLHSTNDIVWGPDGFLYIAQGARTDHGEGEDEILDYEGAILRMDSQTGKFSIIARGFRNPYDLAFHPETGEPLAGDQGYKIPYNDVADELNIIFPNISYGWPECNGEGIEERCKEYAQPFLTLPKNSNIAGMDFNLVDNFPPVYKHNLFVALQGAENNDPDVFAGIVRLDLTPVSQGYKASIEYFATGFSQPVDITFAFDGAMFVLDKQDGIIYKIMAVYE